MKSKNEMLERISKANKINKVKEVLLDLVEAIFPQTPPLPLPEEDLSSQEVLEASTKELEVPTEPLTNQNGCDNTTPSEAPQEEVKETNPPMETKGPSKEVLKQRFVTLRNTLFKDIRQNLSDGSPRGKGKGLTEAQLKKIEKVLSKLDIEDGEFVLKHEGVPTEWADRLERLGYPVLTDEEKEINGRLTYSLLKIEPSVPKNWRKEAPKDELEILF